MDTHQQHTRKKRTGHKAHAQAREQLQRIRYDLTLDQDEYSVGILVLSTEDVDKSGRGSCSQQLDRQAPLSLSCSELFARYQPEALPYHLVQYIAHKEKLICLLYETVSPGPLGAEDLLARKTKSPDQNDTPQVKVCRKFHAIQLDREIWAAVHVRLFAHPPDANATQRIIKRTCRASELEATHWTDRTWYAHAMGYERSQVVRISDAETTAVSADGSSVRVWSVQTGRKIATLSPRMTSAVTALDYDSVAIVAGDAGGTVRVWHHSDFTQARVIKAYQEPVVAVLKLDAVIVSAGRGGHVDLWGLEATSSQALVRHAHPGAVLIGLAASDKVLAVYGTHGITLYDMGSQQQLQQLHVPQPTPSVAPVATQLESAASRQLAGGDSDAGVVGGESEAEDVFAFEAGSPRLRAPTPDPWRGSRDTWGGGPRVRVSHVSGDGTPGSSVSFSSGLAGTSDISEWTTVGVGRVLGSSWTAGMEGHSWGHQGGSWTGGSSANVTRGASWHDEGAPALSQEELQLQMQLLHMCGVTGGTPPQRDSPRGGAPARDPVPDGPAGHVAMHDNILAVSRDSLIALYDVTTGQLITHMDVPTWTPDHGTVWLHVTGWMLLAASAQRGGGISVYDMRQTLGSRAEGAGPGTEPLRLCATLAPSDTRMQISGIAAGKREVLAGCRSGQCCLWSVEDRRDRVEQIAPRGASRDGMLGDAASPPIKGRKKKQSRQKKPSRETRFPKRSTK